MWAHLGPQPTDKVDLFDTTYADDEAAMLTFASWDEALELLPKVLAEVEAAYGRWGFEVNWDQGKSELMLILNGRGMMKAKAKINQGTFEGIEFARPDGTTQMVRNVPAYKHVGTMVQASGGQAMNVEAKKRAARGAHAPLARELRSWAYWPTTRITLLRSLVHSRLLHDLEAGSGYSQAQQRSVQAQHINTVRRALRCAAPSTDTWSRGTDEQVLSRVGVSTAWSQVRVRRLMFAWSLAKHPQPQLSALLQPTAAQPGTWAQELLGDLRAVAEKSRDIVIRGLGDPYYYPEAWWQLMKSATKGEWKTMASCVLRFTPEIRAVPAVTIDRQEWEAGQADQEPQGELHVCQQCPAEQARAFPTQKALNTHMQRAHGALKGARLRLGPELKCPACERAFATRAKLLVHATRSTCKLDIAELPLLNWEILVDVDPVAADTLRTGG